MNHHDTTTQYVLDALNGQTPQELFAQYAEQHKH